MTAILTVMSDLAIVAHTLGFFNDCNFLNSLLFLKNGRNKRALSPTDRVKIVSKVRKG